MSSLSVSVSKKGLVSTPPFIAKVEGRYSIIQHFPYFKHDFNVFIGSLAFSTVEGQSIVWTKSFTDIFFMPGWIVSYFARKQFLFSRNELHWLRKWYSSSTNPSRCMELSSRGLQYLQSLWLGGMYGLW